jgi:GrpB-like predicted nucleotidyltransferase (UPF0157 family)
MPIDIVDYRPSWPAEFATLALDLGAALGPLARRIDHIGSTAVPGLASKDRIDVQVGVADLDRLDAIRGALERAGYALWPAFDDHVPSGVRADPGEWRKALFQPPAGARAANIHVREVGRLNWRYALLFRDFLRAHSTVATSYGELKRRLAPYMPDTGSYADVKDPAVDLVMFAAEEWAARTGWDPNPGG